MPIEHSRATFTFAGAAKLKELPKRTTFIRVNAQLNEVRVESVVISRR